MIISPVPQTERYVSNHAGQSQSKGFFFHFDICMLKKVLHIHNMPYHFNWTKDLISLTRNVKQASNEVPFTSAPQSTQTSTTIDGKMTAMM